MSAFSLFIAFLGLNTDRRLACYMDGYFNRMMELEERYNVHVLRHALAAAATPKLLPRTKHVYFTFYMLVAVGSASTFAWTCYSAIAR
jgi:hypothetical protein